MDDKTQKIGTPPPPVGWQKHFKRTSEVDHTLGTVGKGLHDVGMLVLIGIGVVAFIFAIKAFHAWEASSKEDSQWKQGLNRVFGPEGTVDKANALIATGQQTAEAANKKLFGDQGTIDQTNGLIKSGATTIKKAGEGMTSLVSDVRTDTLPRANRELDSLNDVTRGVADKIVPGVAALMNRLDLTTADLDEHVVKKAGLSLDALTRLMGDQGIGRLLNELVLTNGDLRLAVQHLTGVAANTEASMAHIEEALRNLPEVTKTWADMMKTAKKFQKALLFARFLGLIGPLVGALSPF